MLAAAWSSRSSLRVCIAAQATTPRVRLSSSTAAGGQPIVRYASVVTRLYNGIVVVGLRIAPLQSWARRFSNFVGRRTWLRTSVARLAASSPARSTMTSATSKGQVLVSVSDKSGLVPFVQVGMRRLGDVRKCKNSGRGSWHQVLSV